MMIIKIYKKIRIISKISKNILINYNNLTIYYLKFRMMKIINHINLYVLAINRYLFKK